MPKKTILFIMGVSGSGKSTIGKLLASKLGFPFFDGDDFHPQENLNKMASGKPLNDDDREGWLKSLNKLAKEHSGIGVIIVCSALKEKYRALLTQTVEDESVFVYLKGSFEEISFRLKQREGHFMPPELLKSQFDTLETPKEAIIASISQTPKEIIQHILTRLE